MPKAPPALDLDVTVLCDNLLRAIGAVGRAVGASTFPALTCVAFFAEANQLRAIGASQEQALTTWLGGEIRVAGSFLLPHKNLYETVATWPRTCQLRLTIEHGKTSLVVHAPGFNTTLATLPAVEFPAVPIAPAEGGVVFEQAGQLTGLLAQVGPAAASDAARPILNGVHFKSAADNTLMLEATDGLRIHRTWLRAATPKVIDVVAPSSAIRNALELLAADQPLRLLFVEQNGRIVRLLFVQDTLQILANTLEGTYPELDALILKAQSAERASASLSGTSLLAALARANRIDSTVRMTFAPGQGINPGSLRLETVDPERGGHIEKLAATVSTALELGLNAPLLSAMVHAHDLGASTPIKFGLGGAQDPVTIRHETFTGVLMPMQLPKAK